jgi:hypothetical protein
MSETLLISITERKLIPYYSDPYLIFIKMNTFESSGNSNIIKVPSPLLP